ncbi:MAG: DUF1634 domain-containing protein [Actinomycetota bacterium]|nr:DUF1634 domain-containing protein [Actinomycetota bacterium]
MPVGLSAAEGGNGAGSGYGRRKLSAAESALMDEKVRKVELLISLVLRIGVVVSGLIILVGLGLMFAHHAAYMALHSGVSYKVLTSGATRFPHSLAALGNSLARADGRGVIVLGVMVLILTPVLRVAVGVLSFLYERDIPMAGVTFFVFFVLIASFFLAGV